MRLNRCGAMLTITLRALDSEDLDTLFLWESNLEAATMAAFTRSDPSDRAAFDNHYERIRADPDVVLRVIEEGCSLVGTVASFTVEGDRELTYWVDPAQWGRGIASAACRPSCSSSPYDRRAVHPGTPGDLCSCTSGLPSGP